MGDPHEKENNELREILDRFDIKILPGSEIPGRVEYHVCKTYPVRSGPNKTGMCCKCGHTVFYQDDLPYVPKVCCPCFIKFTEDAKEKFELVGNENSLFAAIMRRADN